MEMGSVQAAGEAMDRPATADPDDAPVPVCYRCEWVAAECVCDEGPLTTPEPERVPAS